MSDLRVTSVRFKNYKSLKDYSLSLKRMNVLVGPNNSGKSTIVGAFRVLESCLRIARSKSTSVLQGELSGKHGYHIPANNFPVSLENVHSDYVDEASEIKFRLSNASVLKVYFPVRGECFFILDDGQRTLSPAKFNKVCPLSLSVVPVLGPVEHEEGVLEKKYVRSNLSTHRASRHFRNYWYHFPDGFDLFKSQLESTWPGMTIEAPKIEDLMLNKLTMFCKEDRYPRELFWFGFGFHVWCQLLTHVSRAKQGCLLVVDEPEIYLHPDLQRKFLLILGALEQDVLIATHSSEIVGKSEPSDIVMVDKKQKSGVRLQDIAGVQNALDCLGSVQNAALAKFASNRKILFVENRSDFFIFQCFAKVLGLQSFNSESSFAVVPTHGAGAIAKIKSLSWGLRELGGGFKVACVFDRDGKCDEQVAEISSEMSNLVDCFFFLQRKEIENYFLNVEVLCDVIMKSKQCKSSKRKDVYDFVEGVICSLADEGKDDLIAQMSSDAMHYGPNKGIDYSTLMKKVMCCINGGWQDFNFRVQVSCGKDILRGLRSRVKEKYGITLSDKSIIDSYRPEYVPEDLQLVLKSLDSFALDKT